MGEPSPLWLEAYEAVGPSRDDMWDWLEAKYLALLASQPETDPPTIPQQEEA